MDYIEYELNKLYADEAENDRITEWAVKLINKFEKQYCPKCGELIKHCSLCDNDIVNCNYCEIGKDGVDD